MLERSGRIELDRPRETAIVAEYFRLLDDYHRLALSTYERSLDFEDVRLRRKRSVLAVIDAHQHIDPSRRLLLG